MIANVLVELSNRNVDKTFSYNIPSELADKVKVGIRVKVPFGNNYIEGFVLEISNDSKIDTELKDIKEVVDEEVILNDELLELGKFLQEKTLSTLISCYQSMLPKALKASHKTNIGIKTESIIELNDIDLDKVKLTSTQQLIIDEIRSGNNKKSELS